MIMVISAVMIICTSIIITVTIAKMIHISCCERVSTIQVESVYWV